MLVPELVEGEKKALIFSAGLRSAKGPAEKENFALFPSTSSGTRSIHFLALYKLIGGIAMLVDPKALDKEILKFERVKVAISKTF